MWPLISFDRTSKFWRHASRSESQISSHIYSNSCILLNFRTNESFTITELLRSNWWQLSALTFVHWIAFNCIQLPMDSIQFMAIDWIYIYLLNCIRFMPIDCIYIYLFNWIQFNCIYTYLLNWIQFMPIGCIYTNSFISIDHTIWLYSFVFIYINLSIPIDCIYIYLIILTYQLIAFNR